MLADLRGGDLRAARSGRMEQFTSDVQRIRLAEGRKFDRQSAITLRLLPPAARGHLPGVTGPGLSTIFGAENAFLLLGWLRRRFDGRRRETGVQIGARSHSYGNRNSNVLISKPRRSNRSVLFSTPCGEPRSSSRLHSRADASLRPN